MGPKSYHDAISGRVLIVKLIFAWASAKVSSESFRFIYERMISSPAAQTGFPLSANTVVKIDKDVWPPILNPWTVWPHDI